MKKQFNEPWIPRRQSMLESPAWRALPLRARQVLEAIETEHLRQRGKKNGDLVAVYRELADYCTTSRRIIARSLRQLEALGFLSVKRASCNLEANRYRLTYLPSGDAPPTDDWLKVKSLDEARERLAVTSGRRRSAWFNATVIARRRSPVTH